jgi:hypothetical protein
MEQVQQNKTLNVSDASAFLRLKKPTPDNMHWMSTCLSIRKRETF